MFFIPFFRALYEGVPCSLRQSRDVMISIPAVPTPKAFRGAEGKK